MKYIFLLLLANFMVLNADDAVILKSGRKVEGTVIVKNNEVHLIGKYGTIIYNASDVTVQKEGAMKTDVTDSKDKNEQVVENRIVPKACQITTRSGRKIIGNVFQKGNDIFFVELDGVVKIDPFVFVKKEELGSNAVKGDAISGERCNVVLKSGRAFSGIVEEIDGNYYVSSVLGVVKVAKKDVDHIEKSGSELNLKEALEKLSEKSANPSASSATTGEATAPAITESSKKAEGLKPELTEEEISKINKKAEEALKASKEKPKEIKTQHETH